MKADWYSMTDSAIAQALGERLEQMRLEGNIPQKEMANELGISLGTYRSAVKGKARFETVIGILRVLGKLENLEDFIPDLPYSPLELLKLEGKKRKRAGRGRDEEPGDEGDLDW